MPEKFAEYGCVIWVIAGAVGLLLVPFVMPIMLVLLCIVTGVGAIAGLINTFNSMSGD